MSIVWGVVSGSAHGSAIIGNARNSIHSHGLGNGMGGAGGPKIIDMYRSRCISKVWVGLWKGNIWNCMHFHGLGGAVGARAAPESLEMHRILYMSMVWGVGRAWALPQSLKMQRTLYTSMDWVAVWVARADPKSLECKDFYGLARAVGCAGGL